MPAGSCHDIAVDLFFSFRSTDGIEQCDTAMLGFLGVYLD